MQLNDLIYLNNLLGEEEVKKYINVSKGDIDLLIKLLRHTNIVNVLDRKDLVKLCQKIAFGKYKKVFVECLCEMNDLTKREKFISKYRGIINEFIEDASQNEEIYLEVFEDLRILGINNKISVDWKVLDVLILEEIENVRIESEKISIKTFLDNGGTISELILILSDLKKSINDFNLDTYIDIPTSTLNDCVYKVEIFKITYLVSLLGSLNLSKAVERELLETYYEGLEEGKSSGFTVNELVVRGRVNLYNYLKENELLPKSSVEKKRELSLKYK